MALARNVDKVLTGAGLLFQGTLSVTLNNSQLEKMDYWDTTGTLPQDVQAYDFTGKFITDEFNYDVNYAKNNLNVTVTRTLFALKNGSVFYYEMKAENSTTCGIKFFCRTSDNTTYSLGSSSMGYYEFTTSSPYPNVTFYLMACDIPTRPYYIGMNVQYVSGYNGRLWNLYRILGGEYDSSIAMWNHILFGQKMDLDDPYITDDNKTPIGGYGPFDYTSEDETPPSLPSISAAQVGFVSLWNPSESEMKDLADYLWTGTFDWTNFRKLFTDPMDCILSVGLIPITPTRKQSGGADVKEEIVFGGSSHSGVNAYPVTEQFYIVDMGTLHIGGMSKGALDYSPYTKASIYLPYCGTYALDVDEIMDSDVELEYHIDIYTGACVAYLTINGHINSDEKTVHATMYQFTGNVLASIPITGNDHSQFIQSMLFMGAAAAATVATSGAGAGAAASGADLGAETAAAGFNKALAGSAINTVMSMKPNVLHSGNLSSTAGLLGGQKPYITMTWSNLCRPEDEQKLIGMPLHKSGTLSNFEGFTIVSACHLENILCTEQELALIEQALAKGVIV